MKRLIPLILWIMVICHVNAIPSSRVPFKVTQPDGTELTLILIGDEHFRYLITTDGIPVKEDDGCYCYAIFKDGALVSSSIAAHSASIRSKEETEFISLNTGRTIGSIDSLWSARLRHKNEIRARRRAYIAGTESVAAAPERRSYIGSKKGLVILVNFSDLKMKSSSTTAVFNDMFNKKGYSSNNHIGSVSDYFNEQSYGQFSIDFDIVGPVTVSNSYKYYGKNNSNNEDTYPGKLVIEACKLADKLGTDFSQYDWDNDGEVEMVYLIYAGYSEANGAPTNTIWPHECTLTEEVSYKDGNGPITLDGVRIDTYAMSNELNGTSGSKIAAIGTACHEFSHCLGLPDLYDTSSNGGFGMNCWDLLDCGNYNGEVSSTVPCGYSAYERWFAGWMDLKELVSSGTYELRDLGNYPEAYVYYNDANRNEFFIIENRQNYRWFSYVDQYTGLHGMLVSHVDYDKNAWDDNLVNTDVEHQRMTIVPANKNYGEVIRGYVSVSESIYRGQLFPGSKNVTSLTSKSHFSYGGELFNKNSQGTTYSNMEINNINEKDGIITFNFTNGSPLSVNEITDSNEEHCTYYNLNGTRLSGTPDTPGIYLMQNGASIRKITIQ